MRIYLLALKICQSCDEDNSPRPKYTINPGDIMIKFIAPEDRGFGSQGVIAKVAIKATAGRHQMSVLQKDDL